jgi:hypothetical protein
MPTKSDTLQHTISIKHVHKLSHSLYSHYKDKMQANLSIITPWSLLVMEHMEAMEILSAINM